MAYHIGVVFAHEVARGLPKYGFVADGSFHVGRQHEPEHRDWPSWRKFY